MFPTAMQLTARAEFYLCLARAMQPPRTEAAYVAFRDNLPDDLFSAGLEAGYSFRLDTGKLAIAIAQHAGDQESLLRIYSRLFLVPPIRVPLNAGVHLDGAVMGRHSVEMAAFYVNHGVERCEDFGDMPDHLSVQLEFVGYLFVQAADADSENRDKLLSAIRDFGGLYLASWLPLAADAITREVDDDESGSVYRIVLEWIHHALAADLAWLDTHCAGMFSGRAADKRFARLDAADSPAALRMMIRKLEEAGLDAGHLRANAESPDGHNA